MHAVTPSTASTPRLKIGYRTAGDPSGAPILFIHGNCSSSVFWDGLLGKLPDGLYGVAVDLRGYGATDAETIDATRGVGDFSDDIFGFWQNHFEGRAVQLVGHSVGGGVALDLAIRHPEMVKSIVLVAPMSPYGFGGTKGTDGKLCYPDAAGSGGHTANPEYVKRIGEKDRSAVSPFSPRSVFRAFFVHEYNAPNEDALVDSVLTTVVGDPTYPGDGSTSENWPNVAPGKTGMNNAISPLYFNVSNFADIKIRPDVLWIRGDKDQIVSDNSMFDFAVLGSLGAVPGWPGDDVYPIQPMVGQMRAVLYNYASCGGAYAEVVIPECGHSPYLEKEDAFIAAAFPFLLAHKS